MPGPPCWYRLLAPGGRLVLFEGHPAEWLFDVDADGGWVATDYDYFAGPEASKGWAPEYIDQLSIDDDDQHWKFARAWTLGEIVTALLGSGLTVERVAEHPTDWWNGHADVRDDERGRIPLSFSVLGAARPPRPERPAGRSTETQARSSASWMTVERSSTSAWRSAGSNSASRSTRTPRAPMARPMAAKSTGPSSVATPSPVPRRPATSGSSRSARCRTRGR